MRQATPRHRPERWSVEEQELDEERSRTRRSHEDHRHRSGNDSVDTKQVDERTNPHDDSNYLVTESEGIHLPTDINSVINRRVAEKFNQLIATPNGNRTQKHRSSRTIESCRSEKSV